ncbi:hypothetical protein LJC55_02945 [Eubacteriales bacterium OttesenSCG-928-N14]|nr:hypothetical protein [Eubacteriales bacterium OttesenSCG-928-N14]
MKKPDNSTVPIIAERVYSLLGEGKENAITGQSIADIVGISLRDVRLNIEHLRKTHIIINDQDGEGYYLSDEPLLAQRYYWQEYSRAISILSRLKPVRAFLKANGVDMATQEREAKKKAI